MSCFLGIDPGLQGALAVYDPSGRPVMSLRPGAINVVAPAMIWDMPLQAGVLSPGQLAARVKAIAEDYPGIVAAIENVSSRPRQQGAFAFGLYTGIVHGCLASAGIPFTLVHPQTWKQAMGLRRHKEETVVENKSRARALAAQLFPAMAPQFKRVRDDGRAEALLLAVYFSNLKR